MVNFKLGVLLQAPKKVIKCKTKVGNKVNYSICIMNHNNYMEFE